MTWFCMWLELNFPGQFVLIRSSATDYFNHIWSKQLYYKHTIILYRLSHRISNWNCPNSSKYSGNDFVVTTYLDYYDQLKKLSTINVGFIRSNNGQLNCFAIAGGQKIFFINYWSWMNNEYESEYFELLKVA